MKTVDSVDSFKYKYERANEFSPRILMGMVERYVPILLKKRANDGGCIWFEQLVPIGMGESVKKGIKQWIIETFKPRDYPIYYVILSEGNINVVNRE